VPSINNTLGTICGTATSCGQTSPYQANQPALNTTKLFKSDQDLRIAPSQGIMMCLHAHMGACAEPRVSSARQLKKVGGPRTTANGVGVSRTRHCALCALSQRHNLCIIVAAPALRSKLEAHVLKAGVGRTPGAAVNGHEGAFVE
jgi:hypothetical protein